MRLWNGTIIDPGSGTVQTNMVLATTGEHIAEIVRASGDRPEDAIDIAGRTVIPGLIDSHLHVISELSRSPGFGPAGELHGEEPRLRELGWFVLANTATALLQMGITTVRDVGALDDEAIVLRSAIDLGLLPGPRIRSCGRIISATAPGGALFGSMYREADGPWEMRKAVREQLRRGADFVKLMATGARSVVRENPEPAQMTRDELAAIVDEAHRLGIRVAAHVEGLAGGRIAVEEGVDTVEHGLSFHREPVLLDEMAKRGTVLVPTLTTFHDLAERFADEWAPALVEQAKRQLEEAYLTLEAADAAGVTLAMGFDSGPPGASAWEAVRMAEGGIGAQSALRAATVGGAAATGMPDLGRLTPGALADFVVVDGDPLAEIRLLVDPQRIRLVVKNGEIVGGRDVEAPMARRMASEDAPRPISLSPCTRRPPTPTG